MSLTALRGFSVRTGEVRLGEGSVGRLAMGIGVGVARGRADTDDLRAESIGRWPEDEPAGVKIGVDACRGVVAMEDDALLEGK